MAETNNARPVVNGKHDVITHRIDEAASAAETVAAAADLAFNGELAVAVLIGQRLIGRKRWVE